MFTTGGLPVQGRSDHAYNMPNMPTILPATDQGKFKDDLRF